MKKNDKYINGVIGESLIYLVKLEEFTIFISGMFISIAMFIQIILRYVFSSPLFGLEEISILIVSWFYFLGAAYSIHHESSIKVDILDLIVKNLKIKKICNIISIVLSFIAAGILFYYSLKYAIWSGKSSIVTAHFLISANVGFSAIVVGSVLMCIHFLALLQKEIKRKVNYRH